MRKISRSKKSFKAVRQNKTKTFQKLMKCERGEFGMSAIIGIAIGLIIAAFILIPGLQTFATTIMTDMELWWSNSISSQIFPN